MCCPASVTGCDTKGRQSGSKLGLLIPLPLSTSRSLEFVFWGTQYRAKCRSSGVQGGKMPVTPAPQMKQGSESRRLGVYMLLGSSPLALQMETGLQRRLRVRVC